MNMTLPRRFVTGIAGITAATVLMVSLITAPAQAQEEAVAEGHLTAVPNTASMTVPTDLLPAVDSEAGWGSALGTDPAVRLSLRGSAEQHPAALVRVTVPAAATDTVVMTGDPQSATRVLFAQSGTTVSTTVLLPVSEGTVPLWASVETDVRVEVLAGLTGSSRVPGSTVALQSPVVRAHTDTGLGGSELSPSQPLSIGVTGEGGVATELVRAVYATAEFTLTEAATVTLNGIAMRLPVGSSSVTSVLTPDAQGMVEAEIDRGVGALKLSVLGWIPEADTDFTQANSADSFVNSTERTTPLRVSVSAREPHGSATLDTTDTADAAHSLVLLSAAASPELSLLDFVQDEGRGAGIAVDPGVGALPQLVLAPAVGNEEQTLSATRGEMRATAYALGDFLHDRPARGAEGPSIEITAPLTQDAIDLGENGAFVLSGVLQAPGAALDRVEISSPQVSEFADENDPVAPQTDVLGTAEFGTDENGQTTWSFEAAAPDDGAFDYVATVFDRSGKSASDEIVLEITAATPDDTVVSNNTVIVNTVDSPQMRLIGPNLVEFDELPEVEPHDVLVSDITATLPDGFMERVVSINRVGGAWQVGTAPAELDEVLFQADIDEAIPLDDPEGIEIIDDASAPVGEVPGGITYDEIDNGVESTEILTGDDVDLDPYPSEPVTLGDEDVTQPHQAARLGTTVGMSFGLKPALSMIWSSEGGVDVTNLSAASEAERQAKKNTLNKNDWDTEAKFGMVIESEVQVKAEVKIVVNVSMKWKWKVIPAGVKVNEFTVQVTTGLKAEVSVAIVAEVTRSLNLSKNFVSFNLPSISFMAGVVPVVITNKLELGLMVDFAATGTITLEKFGTSREDVSGFTYTSKDGMQNLKRTTVTTLEPSLQPVAGHPSAELSGELAVGPRISLESKMYGIFGPVVSAGAQAGVGAELSIPDLHEPLKVRGKISGFGRLVINGKAELKVLQWKLLDIPIKQFELRKNLFERSFSTG